MLTAALLLSSVDNGVRSKVGGGGAAAAGVGLLETAAVDEANVQQSGQQDWCRQHASDSTEASLAGLELLCKHWANEHNLVS
jgi:membrane protein involved in colicin uptake